MDRGYYPLVLKTMTEICAFMGVGKETVRDWIERGAPIAVERYGRQTRYSTLAAELQNWRIGAAKA